MSRLLNWANTRAHKERGLPAGSLFGPSDSSRFAASAEVSPCGRGLAALERGLDRFRVPGTFSNGDQILHRPMELRWRSIGACSRASERRTGARPQPRRAFRRTSLPRSTVQVSVNTRVPRTST